MLFPSYVSNLTITEIQPESVLTIFLAGDTVKVLEELDDFALPPPEQGDNFRTAKFKSRVVED